MLSTDHKIWARLIRGRIIIAVSSEEKITEGQLRRIVDAAIEIASKPS
jgi:hypothetical protein